MKKLLHKINDNILFVLIPMLAIGAVISIIFPPNSMYWYDNQLISNIGLLFFMIPISIIFLSFLVKLVRILISKF